MESLTDSRKPCQFPWHDLSPLVREALCLGFDIESREVQNTGDGRQFSGEALPKGHRYFPDCSREVEARLLSWLIAKYKGNCWFLTLTFRDYTQPDKAKRLLDTFLARLNQAYKDIPGAALLKSVHTTEWQQRDVIHYHLLIYGDKLGTLSRKRWEFRWQMISGGFAANYDAELKAAPYLAKHQIIDKPGGNLHLGGAWRGINPPRSLACEYDSNSVLGLTTPLSEKQILRLRMVSGMRRTASCQASK